MPGDFEYSNDYTSAISLAGGTPDFTPPHIKRTILQLGRYIGAGPPNLTVAVASNAGTITPSTGGGLFTFTNSSAATMTITIATSGAVDGQQCIVRVYDFSAAAETITWVNTENSGASVPTTSNGSTTSPKTVTFMFNAQTTKWRCIESV